ncbi:hypothetical protein GCM10009530_38690 [Microbispora corallina]|uniref:Peptide zinc metalloprotease protein n=1 Tax=Microbispora corallina TaxID=83302 RepID=A0ABQ4G2M8_9ACTN|nr:hypothetical protein [Microbispora corallina]GIH41317.1 hypothetical protein Mco01_43170 [Microbispora corallina]
MTTVRFHGLAVRRDREEWIVGRAETGVCVALPYEGVRAIEILETGATVEETSDLLRRETGVTLDVAGFVGEMAGAGLVAAVDGRPVGRDEVPRPSLPWLTPRLVRWTLSPVLPWVAGALVLAGAVAAAVRPGVVPGWHALMWSPHGTPVLAAEVVLVAALVALHELAHLCTARASGVPGRIRLGTRLQFLAAQTDVSGIWLAGRRARLTVYLAGIAVDAAVLALCLVAMAVLGPDVPLSIVALTEMTGLALQFLVFMRTDLYFVLQDLSGCRDLYADAGAHLRHLARRLAGRPSEDPLRLLRPLERRFVRIYSGVVLTGTAACLAVFLLVSLPFTLTMVCRAFGALTRHATPVDTADAVATLAVLLGYQGAWAYAWARRHGPRLRGLTARAGARLTARPPGRPAGRGRTGRTAA